MLPCPPRHAGIVLLSFVALTAASSSATRAAGEAQPRNRPVRGDQSAERIDWWPRIESIAEILAKENWKRALDRADRLADDVQRDAWSGRDLDRLMAELAFQQAMAELNVGRPNDAVWHWYAAINLRPEIAARDLTPYGKGAELAELGLRRAGEMPEDTDPVSDMDQLRLDPVAFPRVDPPEVTANAVATLRRQADVLIEVVVDRGGHIRQPVLLTEGAHPVLVYASFEWLSRMPPPRPARLDGRPVASLELINIGFTIERDGAQVRLPDIDG